MLIDSGRCRIAESSLLDFRHRRRLARRSLGSSLGRRCVALTFTSQPRSSSLTPFPLSSRFRTPVSAHFRTPVSTVWISFCLSCILLSPSHTQFSTLHDATTTNPPSLSLLLTLSLRYSCPFSCSRTSIYPFLLPITIPLHHCEHVKPVPTRHARSSRAWQAVSSSTFVPTDLGTSLLHLPPFRSQPPAPLPSSVSLRLPVPAIYPSMSPADDLASSLAVNKASNQGELDLSFPRAREDSSDPLLLPFPPSVPSFQLLPSHLNLARLDLNSPSRRSIWKLDSPPWEKRKEERIVMRDLRSSKGGRRVRASLNFSRRSPFLSCL